ncbi:MFS transporter [Alloacidobacterium dinghuense]|uniref:MFS transporter n=1 Tax=Alloacidobacterium dinghuense TaxID=2763107 RepID=A0A7G8BJJ8_9BACT|nr:MFS transporter [Alloacidobacterium dinghuense]QNI32718.1 MFS transporter [Alloacidobacterium dinghuense]
MARNRYMVFLVLLTFFVISLLTNILGPIVPDIISNFRVSLTAAGFLVFSFFIAYGVMSIPAGFLVERFREKPVMIWAFVAAAIGSISFALFPTYKVAVVSLFLIGTGMAILQVAINPLLRVSGGEEHFAFNEVLAQLFFGTASFISPHIYSYLVLNLRPSLQDSNLLLLGLRKITPAALPWVSLYWIFSAIAVAMVLVLCVSRFPRVQHTDEERPGTLEMYRSLIRKRLVWLYFLAIFAYVGCEQGSANWISQFLSQYHGFDPHTTGARAVSWFWGLMTSGCLAGVLLLKVFDSRRVLIGASTGALCFLSLALFGPAGISAVAFPLVGLFASVMWPILISLALNSVAQYHGSFTGILATGIMGGAVMPAVIGRIGDQFGLRNGLILLYLTFGFIFSVGFWAKPLVNNATIRLKKTDLSTAA